MLYSQLGYYFTCKISQSHLKEAIKESLLTSTPDTSLVAILLPGNENNINWEEEGKEFSFHGQMYDVIRTKRVNGQTILFCSNDEKEEHLLEQMNDITESNNQNAGKNSKLPDIKIISDYVCIPHIEYFIFYPHAAHPFIHYDVELPQQTSTIVAPPPRLRA